MKPLLASHILTLTNSLRTWNSSLIVPHNGKLIDISCATQGKKSSVPPNAPDQPPCYPNKSKYRFDIKFEGIDALPALRDMLQKCLHGCEVLSKQSGTNRSSNLRVGNWTFACKHSTVNVNFANKIFADGDMKLSHSVTQTLKKKKGEGSTYSGLSGMYSKTVRNKIRAKTFVSLEDENMTRCPKEEHPRRTAGHRPDTHALKCAMKLIIFLDSADDFYYLSTASTLVHTGHCFVPPEAVERSEKDLDEKDKILLETLFSVKASNHMISKIFQQLKGKDLGTFLPKTIYNMNQKTKRMLDLANGITADMSDAEVTLKKMVQ